METRFEALPGRLSTALYDALQFLPTDLANKAVAEAEIAARAVIDSDCPSDEALAALPEVVIAKVREVIGDRGAPSLPMVERAIAAEIAAAQATAATPEPPKVAAAPKPATPSLPDSPQ